MSTEKPQKSKIHSGRPGRGERPLGYNICVIIGDGAGSSFSGELEVKVIL